MIVRMDRPPDMSAEIESTERGVGLLQFLVDETLNLLPLDSSTPQQRLEQLMFRLEQHLEWHEAAVIDASRACSRDADYQVNVGYLRRGGCIDCAK